MKLTVFPNPANRVVTIASNDNIEKFALIDMLGQALVSSIVGNVELQRGGFPHGGVEQGAVVGINPIYFVQNFQNACLELGKKVNHRKGRRKKENEGVWRKIFS